MRLILRWILSAAALMLLPQLIDAIRVDSFYAALAAALFLGFQSGRALDGCDLVARLARFAHLGDGVGRIVGAVGVTPTPGATTATPTPTPVTAFGLTITTAVAVALARLLGV